MLSLLLLPTLFAATLAPGDTLPNALALHVSQGGLDHLGTAVGDVVPESFTEDELSGEFECDAGDETPLGYAVLGLDVTIDVKDVSLIASDGRLDLDLSLALSATADEVDITGDCTFLVDDLNQVCGLEISAEDPIDLDVHVGIEMSLNEDGTVAATVDDLSYTMGTIGNPLNDCDFAVVIDALLGLNPDLINDLIATFLDPTLADLGPQLETALEDALGGLNIETSLALPSTDMLLKLAPSELTLSDAGLFLGFGASASLVEPGDCADFGEGSPLSSEGWPAYGESAWDEGGLDYDAALLLNKDFVDHLLWNLWATGLFCGNLSDLVDLPLDTDFLSGVMGDSFAAYFPEAQPVELTLEDPEQPTGRFDEDPAIYIDLHGLVLNTAAPLDARLARIAAVGIDGAIAVDPGITSDGIAPALIISTDNFEFSEPYNELLEPGYAEGLGELLPTLLENFLPADLFPTIALPTWQGIGLGSVIWLPSDDGQWQGGFIALDIEDVEPLELSGCSGCGGTDTGSSDPFGCGDTGCGDSGCEGGSSCSAGGKASNVAGGRLALIAALVGLVLRRRRG